MTGTFKKDFRSIPFTCKWKKKNEVNKTFIF